MTNVNWTDLTMQQIRILMLLEKLGPQSMGALKRALGVSGPTVTGITHRLRDKGLIATGISMQDERVRTVRIMPPGVAVLAGLREDLEVAA